MNKMADHRFALERGGLSALVFGAAFCLSMSFAYAQTLAVPAGQQPQLAPLNLPKQAVASAVPPKPLPTTKTPSVSKPEWRELNPPQQLALKPLAAKWSGINEAQKRKWLAVSQNFAALPPAEQTRLHGRMTEWVALSPQERSQARLNFAGARDVPPDERMAKWQAYQALSPEERQELAAQGPLKPRGAATAIKPSPTQKLVVTPTAGKSLDRKDDRKTRPTPRIATAPHEVDHITLLPQPATAAEAAESQ